MLQWCGSFDKMADKGRWGSMQALWLYITTALAHLASDDEQARLHMKLKKFTRLLRALQK